MRSLRLLVLFIALASLGVISVFAQPAPRGGGHPETANGGAFVHRARSIAPDINVADNTTRLVSEYPTASVSPMTDGNPNAVVFLTNNVTMGSGNQWVPFSAGLMEEEGLFWYIVNQDPAVTFQNGTAFNVQVQGKSDTVFVHTAKPDNIPPAQNHITRLDHPLLNGNPDAVISVTQLWKNVYNNHHIGVWYEPLEARWTIFNQDLAPIPLGAKFNVQVLTDPDTTMQHSASGANIFNTSQTQLDHPLLNNNINAQFIVTQRWVGIYNNNPIGVSYENATNKWRIVNTDGSDMLEFMSFNIHITHNGDYYNDGALVNGGFEAPASDSLKKAAAWNSDSAGAGSKRVCNKQAPVSASTKLFSNTGECAFKFKGVDGETRKLVTTGFVDPTVSHNAVDLMAWVKKSGSGVLIAKAKVTLDDGQKASFGLPGADLTGEFDWKPVSAWHNLPPGTSAVKVKIKIKLVGAGKVYLDDVTSSVFNVLR